MAGKPFYVRNNHGPCLSRSRPANTLSKRDVETAKAALIRPHPQQLPRHDHAIEPCPQEPERVMDERCHGCHGSDFILDTFENRISMSLQLCVRPRLWDSA
jgi:hypothetical protein